MMSFKELCQLLNTGDLSATAAQLEELLAIARSHTIAGYREAALLCLEQIKLTATDASKFSTILTEISNDPDCHEGLRETAKEIQRFRVLEQDE